MLTEYDRWLRREERSDATREKYLRSVRAFAGWPGGAEVTKEAVTEWKAQLAAQRRAPSTVNTALAALNGLFRFLGWEDCRAKFLKVQRRIFRAAERELTRAEYDRLLTAAQSAGDTRLALLMESICATGIRVSEVQIPHRRGRAVRPCRGRAQGQDPDSSAARKALPQAAEIRQEAENRPR